jgi:hypothetical protein
MEQETQLGEEDILQIREISRAEAPLFPPFRSVVQIG